MVLSSPFPSIFSTRFLISLLFYHLRWKWRNLHLFDLWVYMYGNSKYKLIYRSRSTLFLLDIRWNVLRVKSIISCLSDLSLQPFIIWYVMECCCFCFWTESTKSIWLQSFLSGMTFFYNNHKKFCKVLLIFSHFVLI